MSPAKSLPAYIPETAFGDWFLQTPTWDVHVLEVALRDLDPMIPERLASYPVVIDVGCGWGRSLRKLDERFKPERLVGFDIAPRMVEAAAREVAGWRTAGGGRVEIIQADSAARPPADA